MPLFALSYNADINVHAYPFHSIVKEHKETSNKQLFAACQVSLISLIIIGVGADAQVIDLEYSHIIPCGTSLAG
jgi:hypothetical protein